jgi:hypothetical protein
MGCGCRSKSKPRITVPRRVSNNQPIQETGGAAQLRANVAPTQVRSASGLNQERRLIEKKRRDAIRNALGKS